MKINSFYENLEYGEKSPKIKVLLNTSEVKEICITFRENQEMKAHKAGFPIVIHILEGCIDFGVNDERILLEKGKIITLEANVIHDLIAKVDSIVRLSLHHADSVERPKQVVSE